MIISVLAVKCVQVSSLTQSQDELDLYKERRMRNESRDRLGVLFDVDSNQERGCRLKFSTSLAVHCKRLTVATFWERRNKQIIAVYIQSTIRALHRTTSPVSRQSLRVRQNVLSENPTQARMSSSYMILFNFFCKQLSTSTHLDEHLCSDKQINHSPLPAKTSHAGLGLLYH
ncbi:hypothetical protein BDR07DRAFT_177671 [Suillus spraguei]|nr:hypothetical protein BDR07DRAFT_177671 [Suillus spraguei]